MSTSNKQKFFPARVCHILRYFSTQQWGGIESAVYHLAREQKNEGLNAEIVCTDAFSNEEEENFHAVKVRRFSCIYPWIGLSSEQRNNLALKGGNPFSWSLLRYLMKLPSGTLLHTHVQRRLGGIVRTVAKWKGFPYVVSLHGGHFKVPLEQTEKMREVFKKNWEWGKIVGWFLGSRRVVQDANALICLAKEEYLEAQKRYPQKPVYLIPNGIDTTFFSTGDASAFLSDQHFSSDDQLILCVSRIDYQKNQKILIEAFGRIADEFPKAQLILIGSISVPEYEKELIQLADKLNIRDKLRIISSYPPFDKRLVSAYHAAQIFVLPSSTEPFGIVILEAWAAGAPVIASRVGGIPDFVSDGNNGLLFENGNTDLLTNCLRKLLNDKKKCQKLSEQAQHDVQAFDWKNIQKQVQNVYEKVYSL